MPALGETINIDTIVDGARTISTVMGYLSEEELLADQSMIKDMVADLELLSRRTIGSLTVAAFGSYFLGEGAAPGCYTEVLTGVSAGLAGRFDGVSTVYSDEPVVVDGHLVTNVVHALEFQTVEMELGDVDLGVAQLFRRVAVPLLGHDASLFELNYLDNK